MFKTTKSKREQENKGNSINKCLFTLETHTTTLTHIIIRAAIIGRVVTGTAVPVTLVIAKTIAA